MRALQQIDEAFPQLHAAPLIQLREPWITPAGRRRKRAFDLAVAVPVLLLAIPLIVLVAILVKLTSDGPVFFRQARVGRHGDTFAVLKFRTMRDGADREVLEDAALRAEYEANGYKLDRDDPRITPLGRILRATSIDELPQLLNVLRGDMSLVGIRPLVEPELRERSMYEQACYCSMPPGLTGRWQVCGRSKVDVIDRRALDVEYVESWSLWGDLKLLARTPLAVVRVSEAH